MMHNSLIIKRMVIKTAEGKTAYDQFFKNGVNIIRGDNSSGKSTITHFIFYGLGGEFVDFVPEAKECSEVQLEVELNGLTVSLKRYLEIDDESKVRKNAPMYVFLGNYTESVNPPENNPWKRYGYKSSSKRISFSNLLFDFLDIPIVKGESNITMHQLLRLLYIDQNSPTASLFYYENFDTQLTRETVSEILLGVYDEDIYTKKRELIETQNNLDDTKAEIKSIKKFFSDHQLLIPANILQIIENKEIEISITVQEISLLREEEKKIRFTKNVKLRYEELHNESILLRKSVLGLKDKIDLLEASIEESEFFIETLNEKLDSIKVSIKTREYLGELDLAFCPECLSSIKTNNSKNQCKLCKEDVTDQFGIIQARKIEQEIKFQLKESNAILKVDRNHLDTILGEYETKYNTLRDLQKKVNLVLNDVKSVNSETIDKLREKKGFIEGEILQFRTLLENAEQYQSLIESEIKYAKLVALLKSDIRNREIRQKNQKTKIKKSVKEQGLYLLNNDFERQDEFKEARDFHIDFSNNIAFLDSKHAKYSASSNFYLKVTARFALFLASLEVESMRFPRFIFADNMEDKGIEEARAQNLQKLLITKLEDYKQNDFQVIYTTSYITEELNNSEYVIGEYYTKKNRSLKINV